AVDEVGTEERAHGAQFLHAAQELAASEVDVVWRQHRDELQLIGAVLTELVDPVVVRLAEGQREMRVHVVAGEEAQARGGEEDGDVDALHGHAHDLRHGIVLALDREIEASRVGQARARERLGAVRGARLAALAVLLQLGIHRGGQAVDDDGAALGPPIGADGQLHSTPEPRIEVLLEQIRWLHDVHVAVDEPEPIFHDPLLTWLSTPHLALWNSRFGADSTRPTTSPPSWVTPLRARASPAQSFLLGGGSEGG